MKITLDQVVDKIFRSMVALLFVLALLAASFNLMRTAGFVPVDSKIVAINNTPDYAMGGVQGETILQQTFKAKWPIERIGIKIATYDRENPGQIYLRVFNKESGETLTQSVKAADDLVDNDFNIFILDKVIPGDKQTYVIEVSGTASNVLQSAGVWCSFTDSFPEGRLTVNEFETDGDMAFFLASTQKKGLAKPVAASITLASLMLIVILGWILFNRLENRRHS